MYICVYVCMYVYMSYMYACIYVTVLAKRDHFVVKQIFENSTKITTYRKVHEFCFFMHNSFLYNPPFSPHI